MSSTTTWCDTGDHLGSATNGTQEKVTEQSADCAPITAKTNGTLTDSECFECAIKVERIRLLERKSNAADKKNESLRTENDILRKSYNTLAELQAVSAQALLSNIGHQTYYGIHAAQVDTPETEHSESSRCKIFTNSRTIQDPAKY